MFIGTLQGSGGGWYIGLSAARVPGVRSDVSICVD